MALIINNFWGAETGGLEEIFSGSFSAIDTKPHSGTYSYRINVSQTGVFAPFESVADAGTGYVMGIWLYPSINVVGVINLQEGAAIFGNLAFTGVDLDFHDDSGTKIGTGTGVLTADEWNYIELYFQHSTSAAWEYFVGGTSVDSGSGADLSSGGTFDGIGFDLTTNGTFATYFDDMYLMSGATAASDRLGGSEVLAYRSSLANATGDVGGALDIGTWDLVQAIPFAATVQAEYTNTGAGSVDTDDGGGNTLININKSIDLGSGTHGGMAISPAGTELFIVNRSTDFLKAYDLSPAWDLESASSTTGKNTASTPAQTFGLSVSEDGFRYYLTGDDLVLYQWNCSSAWDLSTASYASKSLDVSTEITTLFQSTHIAHDGTKIFCSGNSTLERYSMSTAYELDSASVDAAQSFDFDGFGNPTQIQFINNGSRLYAYFDSGTTGVIHGWDLSTAYDLTSRVYIGFQEVPFDLDSGWLGGDGANFYALDVPAANDRIRQYQTTGGDLLVGGGPANDGLTESGDIVAIKAISTMQRSGGGGTDHFILLGNDVDGTTRSVDLAPTTGLISYFMVSELTSIVPTNSEFCRIGFEQTNAQDYECSGMLAQILHVPPPPPEGVGIIYKPNRLINNFLVR